MHATDRIMRYVIYIQESPASPEKAPALPWGIVSCSRWGRQGVKQLRNDYSYGVK